LAFQFEVGGRSRLHRPVADGRDLTLRFGLRAPPRLGTVGLSRILASARSPRPCPMQGRVRTHIRTTEP
jgi:hypothetical protein